MAGIEVLRTIEEPARLGPWIEYEGGCLGNGNLALDAPDEEAPDENLAARPPDPFPNGVAKAPPAEADRT